MLTFLFSLAAIWTLFWLIMYMLDWSNHGAVANAKRFCNTCSAQLMPGTVQKTKPHVSLPSVNTAATNAQTPATQSSVTASGTAAPNSDSKKKADNTHKQQTTEKKPVADKHDQANVKPLFVAPDEKDDLKEIKGIGVVMEKTLNDLGITTFKQLAGFKKADVKMVSEVLTGFADRIERDEWVLQAKGLAKKAS